MYTPPLLCEARCGHDAVTLQEAYERLYPRLRAFAHRLMQAERIDHTWSATGLTHEVFLRLARYAPSMTEGEYRRFFALAARCMRHVLVSHARAKGREKRGGRVRHTPLSDLPGALFVTSVMGVELLDLDVALERLAAQDPAYGRIVTLRFYAGLSLREAAAQMEISEDKAERLWKNVQRNLRRELSRTGH